jgi:NDP-sugar pyrophosphorylase family protein
MQAMIFAAGLGTRLRPLTNDRPKALVTVGGQSLLAIVLHRLAEQGFERAVVNVHHFADQVIEHLQQRDFGLEIRISDEREQLLDTGGGLRHAQPLLGEEPFLLHNVDILTDLDYAALRAAYAESGNTVAALAIRRRKTSRYLLFDEQLRLAGWRNDKTGERILKRAIPAPQDWAYSGIGWFGPDIFHYLPPEGVAASLIPALLAAAADGRVVGYPHDSDRWLDVGKPTALARAEAWYSA